MDTMTLPMRGRPESQRSADIRENMEVQSTLLEEIERLGALKKYSRHNLEMDLADNEPQRLVIKSLEDYLETTTDPENRRNLEIHIANLKKAYDADLRDDQLKYDAVMAIERAHRQGLQEVEELRTRNRILENRPGKETSPCQA
jgi:hypothetical protein